MSKRVFVQPVLCATGFHSVPPPRDPPGPVVAICDCCGKGLYCYGLSHCGPNIYPTLLVPNFPRVLGPMSAV